MLLVLSFLQCNSCQGLSERHAVSYTNGAASWSEDVGELEYLSQQMGWELHDDGYLCPECAEGVPCLCRNRYCCQTSDCGD